MTEVDIVIGSGVTVETVAEKFRTLVEKENESMFAEGILILRAIEAGLPATEVKKECGIKGGMSVRTLETRLRVARIFDTNYAKDYDWSIHALCASAPGVVAGKPETYSIARDWLDIAVAGYVENGVERPHTTRTLKRRMKPTTEAKPESPQSYTFTACIVNKFGLAHEITLLILEDYEAVAKLPLTGVFTVTITPQATAELEAAA